MIHFKNITTNSLTMMPSSNRTDLYIFNARGYYNKIII